jgi:hypothetical protein
MITIMHDVHILVAPLWEELYDSDEKGYTLASSFLGEM